MAWEPRSRSLPPIGLFLQESQRPSEAMAAVIGPQQQPSVMGGGLLDWRLLDWLRVGLLPLSWLALSWLALSWLALGRLGQRRYGHLGAFLYPPGQAALRFDPVHSQRRE
ncbi:hypothetical protein K9N68_22580 [Kovacikia minuta CCNUW1]|uniref:hypothetical protein n=1 Tax=Kovacikia minuta TaxID=2931930 RepID=UPI001CCF4BC8|nr:hypothetical protein [Kovacikia minuta]UBF24460.1 hypothetical protein K9N68_22580 [Kovacikia minuta CCNUW1]